MLIKKYVFIKPESLGTSLSALPGHTVHYLESLYRKGMKPEANEGAKMRKEHTPEAINKAWKDLIKKSLNLTDQNQKNALQEMGLKYGIYKMLELIEKNKNAFGDEKKVGEFIDLIKKMYPNDHLDIRKGNEVIITEKELKAERDRPEVTITEGSGSLAEAMQPLNITEKEPVEAAPTPIRIVEEHFGNK